VGDPLLRRPIDGMYRRLDDGNPTPHCPDENLHLKLISLALGPKVQGFRKRVDPKPGLGIGKPSPA
jgi:hypothetical protein